MKTIGRVVWLASVLALTLTAENKKIASDAGKSTTVVIQFNSDPDSSAQTRIANTGAKLKQYLGNLRQAVYEVPNSTVLNQIAAEPNVQYITPDRAIAATSLDYTVSSIYADFGSNGYATGKGISVAVIDSGVNATGDFTSGKGRVIYRADLTGGNNPNDEYGHGTHVASMIGGDGTLSNGKQYFRTFAGVAPEVNIVSLKVLDRNGNGSESSVIRGIDAAIALKNSLNIRVINLSLGRPIFESYAIDPLCQAVERAWKAGIVVVVAAGNGGRNARANGYGTIMSPANDPYVITVGAMKDMANNSSRTDDRIATYSSKGPALIDHVVKPDVVAPGNLIIADMVGDSTLAGLVPVSAKVPLSLYMRTSVTAFSTDYYRLSGTSMSAALVSGAAALMVGRDSSLSPDTVKARLMKTAYKTFPFSSTTTVNGKTYTSYYDIFTVGAGYIDVQAALRSKDTVPATKFATSPIAQLLPGGKVKIVTGQNIIWGGDDTAWATNIIWGGDELSGTNIIWGGDDLGPTNIIWGGDEQAFNIIWGGDDGTGEPGPTNIIWGGDEGTGEPGPSNIIWGGDENPPPPGP